MVRSRGIEYRQHTAVGAVPDEPTESLQKAEDRQGNLIVAERIAARGSRMASMRAAVTGSPGDANGSLSMMTQLRASPTTSTPCQKLDVPSSTACGVLRN